MILKETQCDTTKADMTSIISQSMTELHSITHDSRPKKAFLPKGFSRIEVPLQLLSSQGKTQFCMPLHTREVLMHMLVWQKNAPLIQGAKTQTQVYMKYVYNLTKHRKLQAERMWHVLIRDPTIKCLSELLLFPIAKTYYIRCSD